MGRAKVVMEPIKNDKKRNITFLRRKEAIFKKALELTTLCDINVSVIVIEKDQQLEIFPPDPHKFNTSIDNYTKKRITDPAKVGFYNVSDFFTNRKIKIEEQLAKAKKNTLEARYPTWFDILNGFSEGQLREFALGLGGKIDHVQTKIQSLKKIPENLDCFEFHPNGTSDYNYLWFDSIDDLYNAIIEQPLTEMMQVNPLSMSG